jgi:hypothetical protein
MTIVLSAASPSLIVVSVDSAVTRDFRDGREYSTGRKAYLFPGVGCVATWGARDGNQIGRFLENKITSREHAVEELRSLVNTINRNAPTRFDLRSPDALVRFGDFVARFAGELTPEVGPPFLTHLISPLNETRSLKNDQFSPLDPDQIEEGLRELGINF